MRETDIFSFIQLSHLWEQVLWASFEELFYFIPFDKKQLSITSEAAGDAMAN